ncbi:MAG: hypothetical protein QM784_02620 [Polyangiaceae bacterium]
MSARLASRSFGFLGMVLRWSVAVTALAAESEQATDVGSSADDENGVSAETPSSSVRSSGDTEAAGKGPEKRRAKDTGHQGQFTVRLDVVASYRIVMRYDSSPLCADPQAGKEPQKFCGFGAPAGLETAVGYAPTAGIEPFLWGRFGLASETKTHTAPLLVFGAGVRLYSMSDAPFKFFIEPAFGAELEGRASGATDATGTSSAYKQDWLVRLAVGPQYDFLSSCGHLRRRRHDGRLRS